MENQSFQSELLRLAKPFENFKDLDPLLKSLKDKKIVMLGESTHGTQEFYEWRSLISKKLVKDYGFNFIALEADWPPCQKINESLLHFDSGQYAELLKTFSRWPTWMWGNAEMIEVMEWMKGTNAGIFGLDVYSFFESMNEATQLVSKLDPLLGRRLEQYYSCFDAYHGDEMSYVKSLVHDALGCHPEVIEALQDLLEARLSLGNNSQELFDATQNARIVRNAERYYRSMISLDEDSWNVRDEHMLETLDVLLNHYGPDSRCIVWAHNTHIGDYSATDMILRNEINLGGLAREKYGAANVSLVGLGTHHGQVIASRSWDGPVEVMSIPPAKEKSLEHEMHQVSSKLKSPNLYFMMDERSLEGELATYRGQRAIGVVYQSEESKNQYVPTSFAKRYDAYLYFDKSHGVTPLSINFDLHKFPETYPFRHDYAP